MTEADKAEVASFEIPKNTLGLHILYQPKVASPEVTVDIIAVHGLGGDSFSTWTDKSTGLLWLRDFLPRSPEFANARIMTFGYDSRAFIAPFTKDTTGRIFTFAEQLLTDLNDQRVYARGRPIIFVGHSLGGLVIKSALIYAKARQFLYQDIFESVKSIIFFGTPHQGADVAIWATYLGHISKAVGIRRANVTKELQTWSNTLTELTTLFSEQIPDLLITTFFETQPAYGVIVVPEGSARIGQRNEVSRSLNESHISICKYKAPETASYRTVLARFVATLMEISNLANTGAQSLTTAPNPPESLPKPKRAETTKTLEERLEELRRNDM